MLRSAGFWVDGGMTSEIFEDGDGQTYVVTYKNQAERAARVKMIDDFANTYCEQDTCSMCGHKFEEYNGMRDGWHHMETRLTCGHSLCLVCQLELIASALEHSPDHRCLPYDTRDEVSGEIIPACSNGRLCTEGKLTCPKCKKIDGRTITDVPSELGFEHAEVRGFRMHELVQRRLRVRKRRRVPCRTIDRPWMVYNECQRSKICQRLGDCLVIHPRRNPKRPGTAAARRWEQYKDYRYIWQMFRDGFGSDVAYHMRNENRGHMHIVINEN